MARKDNILNSFLNHPMLKEKYELDEPLPSTTREALNSQVPIIKAIALIVENLEGSTPPTDLALHKIVTQYLNSAAI
jgi:hypothetical protein